ncbi:MAG: LD-carboxypeptidase [Muribaculaceae bacterium]
MIIPRSLGPGAKIAIVSPSSIIKPQNVYNALPVLRDRGWEPVVSPHAFDRHGSFAGTADNRYSDLAEALTDPEVDAILCSRGGYGAVHLLERLARLPLEDTPKWLIGFSDISALHALLTSRGIASIHAPMAKALADNGADNADNRALLDFLAGEGLEYSLDPSPMNRLGDATGLLVGGNLSVISDLVGTPFDVIKPRRILFIEDVNEPIYKIERMLYQLRLSGVLADLAGLIVGKFSGCAPDADFASVNNIVADLTRDYSYPVAYDIPVGHVTHNIPLVCGAACSLSVGESSVEISQ